ncbi:hypothetical protein [Ornithinimicrobium flavum]|uniref:hypothetical protein n=1 Tax=Ornithinimicrobium flavum TaxID=1288636 RepID=UPI00106F6404|nr:hypothetical protein [Ornithinimicrobium flavum]
MAPSTRAQNALLAALAAVAVGASGFAVWSVNRPHPSLSSAEANSPSMASGTEDATATATATAEPTEPVADTTASPTSDPAQTAAPDDDVAAATQAPEDDGATVEEWVAAWQEEANLLVVGDGYSNLTTQWVQQWATLVAQERPVQIRHWGEGEDRTFTAPIVLSEGEGPALRVWSASRGGTTIAQAADRLDRFDRVSADPAAILISLGMDSEEEDIASAMDELLDGLHDVPVLVAIAPEGLYEPGVADDLLTWAQDNEERVAVVDLRETGLVEPTAEEWALAFQEAISDARR